MEADPEDTKDRNIELLIKSILNGEMTLRRRSEQEKTQSAKEPRDNRSIEIDNLDINDYLQLFAHQKKHLSTLRWRKLVKINQSLQMEQESYKHFFAIASHSNFRRLEHPGYYKQLLEEKKNYPSNFFVSIDKDIPRTLSNTHPFQQSLRNVLSAYAIRNPSLLYCQGMNYIVAFLLINEMSQEQVFWFLACLVENILPQDYFKDLTTVSIVSCIFNDVLDEIFPQFQMQMIDVGMDSSVFLVPWYVCLFSKGFINSVSAYILSYILLEARLYRVGYILLKISLALIAVVLNRQQPFTYIKDFKSFKDTLQTKIYQISLTEIKEGIKMIELNYDIYVQIEQYYRRQKEQARQMMLKSRDGKKLPLPVCSKDYPICFHRIEMEKKIGSIENALILKNGFDIRKQMIDNYLDTDLNDSSVDISYNNIQQCQIGRQTHICHLNALDAQQNPLDRRNRLQRDTVHKIELLNDAEEETSLDQNAHVSTMENRFAELSEYFVVDENYAGDENEDSQFDQELKKELEYYSVEDLDKIQEVQSEGAHTPKKESNEQRSEGGVGETGSIRAVVGKAWRKVLDKIVDFKKLKSYRQSKTEIAEPPK